MSKKYLSIEEAAAKVGVSTAELNRLREKGSIRAFADRGTWKFKEDDVQKLARSRQADSNPDVPLASFESSAASDLVFDDDSNENSPTIIRTGRDDSGSDSDVRLIFDDSPSSETVKVKAGAPADDSDSDVKLAGGAPAAPKEDGSDSDVKLVTDMEPAEAAGSDSDVQLVSSDSSGDVKVASSGDVKIPSSGDVKVPSSGDVSAAVTEDSSAVSLTSSGEGSSVIEHDSGISLAEGSGIALASDSGISLERPNDSGISLSEESSILLSEDSGISLAQDSGISLSKTQDSGISLSKTEDSGISLSKSDSGIALGKTPAGKDSGISLSPAGKPGGKGDKKGKGKDSKTFDSEESLTGTVPLMDMPLAEDEDILDTQMEVPMLDDSSEGGSTGSGTSVITLDEDDSEYSVATGKGRGRDTGEKDVFTADEAIIEDEEVDVADEIVGEDDELAEDVFGAEDEDFGDVESGVSSAELPAAPRLAAAVEQDWGTGTFVAVSISAAVMIFCSVLMFDVVRNMWQTDQAKQNPISSMVMKPFEGL